MTGTIKCWAHEIRDPDCPKCTSETTPSPATGELKADADRAVTIVMLEGAVECPQAYSHSALIGFCRRALTALRTPPATGEGETIASIIQWGDETFGPCTAERAIFRAGQEWTEMIEPDADVPIEAADVIICLLRIPGIAEAIQRKMGINRGRTWRLMGDGTGYHVPAEENRNAD